MNDINIKKYDKIKEVRNKIRDLSFSLGDLVNMLDNKLIDDKAMKMIEEQAWNMVKQINEISKDYGKK